MINMISQYEFEQFEKVRESGKTNMYDLSTVSAMSGLGRDKLKEIMTGYDKLAKKWRT